MKLAATSLLLTISSLSLLSSAAAAKPQHESTVKHESTVQHEGTTQPKGTTQHETPATAKDTSAEEKIAAGEQARRQGNYPQAQSQIKLGLSQIQNSKNPSPERLAAAYNYLALLNNSMGQYADSEQNARRALSLGRQAKLSETILARHRVVLANALRQQGIYPEAQSNLEKAISTLKTSNHDKELFATATNNLGALYFWMGNYQQAITILRRGLALRLAIAAGDKENLEKENLENENLDIANLSLIHISRALNIRHLAHDSDSATARELLLKAAGEKFDEQAIDKIKSAVPLEVAAWLLPVLKTNQSYSKEISFLRKLINSQISETASTASTNDNGYGGCNYSCLLYTSRCV